MEVAAVKRWKMQFHLNSGLVAPSVTQLLPSPGVLIPVGLWSAQRWGQPGEVVRLALSSGPASPPHSCGQPANNRDLTDHDSSARTTGPWMTLGPSAAIHPDPMLGLGPAGLRLIPRALPSNSFLDSPPHSWYPLLQLLVGILNNARLELE